MQKSLLAVVAAGLLSLSLSACQTTPPAAAKAELNDEAKIALSWAEADVKDAHKAGALWTTAADELKAAKAAAAKGDSAAAIKLSKAASTHAKLGLEQKKYPIEKISEF